MQDLHSCFLNIYFFGSLDQFSEHLKRLTFYETELIFNFLIIKNRELLRDTLILEKLLLARRKIISLIEINTKKFEIDTRKIQPYI